MLVGILSDSHGDAVETARAVALLEGRGARKLFHCGDLCGERVLDVLAGHDCSFVWGNCDHPTPTLRRYVAALGLPWPSVPVRAAIDGRKIAVFHGHEREFDNPLNGGPVDYVFYGHTHRYGEVRREGCRFINPGALYRARLHTVALLDVASGRLEFLRTSDGAKVE